MQESGDSAKTENENVRKEHSDSLKTNLEKNKKLRYQTKNQEDDRNKLKDTKNHEGDSERSPQDPVLQNDRFNKEFIFHRKFGTGGFGEVYEVTHKVDDQKYAVKKVPFKVNEQFVVQQDLDNNESRIKIQLEGNIKLKETLREVRLLAKLRHDNVVNYNCSWLESGSTDGASSESSSSYESTGNGSDDTHDSSSSSSLVKQKVTLYIQMELCSTNLQKWLEDRNAKWFNNRNTIRGKESDMFRDNVRIFKEMLEGVGYIHRKELMHRDLKPANIFLTGPELTVKIGDFGLSKYKRVEYNDQALSDGGGLTDHSPDVGTIMYAAPEIKTPTYDFKVDIYSLGLIFFEIFNNFGTEWEKIETMKPLKSESKCPVDFQQTWTNVATIINKLINRDPTSRPSAEEILKFGLFSPMTEATSMSDEVAHTLGGPEDLLRDLEESTEDVVNLKSVSKLSVVMKQKMFLD